MHYFGVADGVGGWNDRGVNPAIFSWKLMNYCHDYVNSNVSNLELSPLDILQNAFDNVQNDNQVKAGSSTACIVKIDSNEGNNKHDGNYNHIHNHSYNHNSNLNHNHCHKQN